LLLCQTAITFSPTLKSFPLLAFPVGIFLFERKAYS
jgi:hypothetical protein